MIIAIWLPHFSLQAAVRSRSTTVSSLASVPAILVSEHPKQRRVLACSPAARIFGVEVDMEVGEVLARCPQGRFYLRSLAQEIAVTTILKELAERYTSELRHVDGEICMMQCEAAPYGMGWYTFGKAILEELASEGIEGRVGIAQESEVALLAAQQAEPVKVVYDVGRFLCKLPIEVIQASEEASLILRIWGINRVGDLLQLSRDEVVKRLGGGDRSFWQCALRAGQRLLQKVESKKALVEALGFQGGTSMGNPLLVHPHGS